ncbi:MAG: DUF2971 domain-containing protein [Bacteroidota bacterium]
MEENEINKFINEFNVFIKKYRKSIVSEFSFEKEIEFISNKTKRFIDLAILRNNELLAIVEFKSLQTDISKLVVPEIFQGASNITRFSILANNKMFLVYDSNTNQAKQARSISEVVEIILSIPLKAETERIKKQIADIIHTLSNKYFKDRVKIKKHFTKKAILDNIHYDPNGNFFHLSKDVRVLDNFENTFFQFFFESLMPDEKVYRYSTLDTIYATINYNSIRLNGLVGMNDISEIGYVDSYLDSNYSSFGSDTTAHQTVSAVNRRFISCASSLEDDLNQWRLYSDDSKGACLSFRVEKKVILPGVLLRRVSYGIKKGNKNYHPELEFIKSVMDEVKTDLKQTLKFRTLSIWKHFFKSFEYAPEKEVRLLIIISPSNQIKGEHHYTANPRSLQKQWNLTYSHKILNPFITIQLNDTVLPFKLEKIILGPKCPEMYANKKQFEELLRFQNSNGNSNLKDVRVELSSIKNYR